MAQGRDLLVNLGEGGASKMGHWQLNFNVTDFLRKFNSYSHERIRQLDLHMEAFDRRVHINTQIPGYAQIYNTVGGLLGSIVDKLKSKNSMFNNSYLMQAGSIYGDIKVGLPHEADYLLVLPRPSDNSKITVTTIYSILKPILMDSPDRTLFQQAFPLEFLGMKQHGSTGICLFFKTVFQDGSAMGISVDLTPVYRIGPGDQVGIRGIMENNASIFIGQTWDQLVHRGDIYVLIERRGIGDTGIVESNIMRMLPESYRQSFRVAKFLLQFNAIGEPSYWRDWSMKSGLSDLKITDFATYLGLYGLKCPIPSYLLRVCFLHLLIQTHGTQEASQLHGGRLTLCLLHMMLYLHKTPERYIKHPIQNTIANVYGGFDPTLNQQIWDLTEKFESMSMDLNTLPLFNYTPQKYESLTQRPL